MATFLGGPWCMVRVPLRAAAVCSGRSGRAIPGCGDAAHSRHPRSVMPPTRPNPLLSDRDVAFHLYEELDAEGLTRLPAFAAHSREGFDLFLASCRRLAREQFLPL